MFWIKELKYIRMKKSCPYSKDKFIGNAELYTHSKKI